MALLCQSPLAYSQDRNAPATLEDLIPDSAVESPEGWAQGEDEAAPQDSDAALTFEEFPPPPMGWPDEAELAPVDPIEPNEQLEIATVDAELVDPFADSDVEKISDELELAFPTDRALFPIRDEFIERFVALSAIEELESDDDSLAVVSARARSDAELLGTLLRAHGYYDAQVVRSVGRDEEDGEGGVSDQPVVRFAIIPGPRYTIGSVDLGELSLAPDHETLRAAFEVQSGDLISSYVIEQERFDLDSALGEGGYPFAEIDAPELLVDHARDEGDLTMIVRPQGKYVFGEVTSSMPKFLSGRHLATIARFDPGDTYQRSLELDLRRAITATGLVSSVEIAKREVTPPSDDEPGVVALDVDIAKAKLRTIAGAVGYGTEEGFRVEASWEHRNFFPPEGAVRVRGIAGTQEQLAGITYRRNNIGGRDRILNIDAYARAFENDVYEANTAALITTYERVSTLLFQKPLSWSIGVELVATDERDIEPDGTAPPRETFLVAALPVSALLDTTDDLLDPREGFRLGGRVSPEISRQGGMESTYVSTQLDASYYQAMSETIVLAARTRIGTIVGTETFNIAPSRRLYSGGGSSVRGYGYQEIGPRNDAGEPNGGRSLVELSAEARIRTKFFDGALGVVPFIDAGSVSRSSTPDFDRIRVGAGVGIRYHTGFGPIRVDLGIPINPGPDDNAFAVYVSLGQAF